MNMSMTRLCAVLAPCVACCTALGGRVCLDLSKDGGPMKKDVHSSGWAPRAYPRAILNDDESVRAMNLTYARTHDWALVNPGQRVVDVQYLFPLPDLDPKDERHYVFGPTDHLLSLARNVGLQLFYRLGTSIEHTGEDVHFNACVPRDFEKTAEVFAGIVRHYNDGWANGKHWGIRYWEIWNEPDGLDNMWWLPKSEGGMDADLMREKFIRFFVTCLKRLTTEFPDIKVGGPGLCWMDERYFRSLLKACREAEIAPGFISWHYYGDDPEEMEKSIWTARKMCDEMGFPACELILNEYHYILTWKGVHGRNCSPSMIERALQGKAGHNNIDAACFYLTMLCRMQTAPIDQAYYYGCEHQGLWGYADHDRRYNKTYFAARMFGDILRDYPRLGEVRREGPLTVLAASSTAGDRTAVLVVDYRGLDPVIEVELKGCGFIGELDAIVMDDSFDLQPCQANFRGGVLRLTKTSSDSAAFLVTFTKGAGQGN